MRNMLVNVASFFTFLCIVSCSNGTNVNQCPKSEQTIKDLTEKVTIEACRQPPCRLKQNTTVKLEMKLTPDRDVQNVTNSVSFFITGTGPFPVWKHDETDACKNIYSSDGWNQVGCPLKKGEDYLYKRVVEIRKIYPRMWVLGHWALVAQDGKELIWFEVPLKIIR